jgi:hypothetical protein
MLGIDLVGLCRGQLAGGDDLIDLAVGGTDHRVNDGLRATPWVATPAIELPALRSARRPGA